MLRFSRFLIFFSTLFTFYVTSEPTNIVELINTHRTVCHMTVRDVTIVTRTQFFHDFFEKVVFFHETHKNRNMEKKFFFRRRRRDT